jgi:hypothetical protein
VVGDLAGLLETKNFTNAVSAEIICGSGARSSSLVMVLTAALRARSPDARSLRIRRWAP